MSATLVKNRATVARPTATGKATPRRERELFVRWRRDRDAAAQEELVARFSPLSRSLARRYRHTSEPFEDLYQIAQLGLVKAIDGYDPERGIPFTAYAVPTILGELRRHFRTATWAAHVPRAAQERALELRKAERILVDEHGVLRRFATSAQFMELSEEEVLDAIQTQGALVSVSLDAPAGARRVTRRAPTRNSSATRIPITSLPSLIRSGNGIEAAGPGRARAAAAEVHRGTDPTPDRRTDRGLPDRRSHGCWRNAWPAFGTASRHPRRTPGDRSPSVERRQSRLPDESLASVAKEPAEPPLV